MRRGTVANVISHPYLRSGALIWLVQRNGSGRQKWYGLNKNGKYVLAFIDDADITNRRTKWVPDHLINVVEWHEDVKHLYRGYRNLIT